MALCNSLPLNCLNKIKKNIQFYVKWSKTTCCHMRQMIHLYAQEISQSNGAQKKNNKHHTSRMYSLLFCPWSLISFCSHLYHLECFYKRLCFNFIEKLYINTTPYSSTVTSPFELAVMACCGTSPKHMTHWRIKKKRGMERKGYKNTTEKSAGDSKKIYNFCPLICEKSIKIS